MKPLWLKHLLLLSVAFLITPALHAVPLITVDAPVKVSQMTNFEVTIGIEGVNPENLGAFEFDVTFTPNSGIVFLPYLTSFGDQLNGGDPLDSFGSIDITDLGSSVTNLFITEVSFLLDLSVQADDFTLITLGFYAPALVGPGALTAGVLVQNIVLSDADGFAMTAANDQAGTFITIVPEPHHLLIFSLGLLVLQMVRRFKKKWS